MRPIKSNPIVLYMVELGPVPDIARGFLLLFNLWQRRKYEAVKMGWDGEEGTVETRGYKSLPLPQSHTYSFSQSISHDTSTKEEQAT
jgi:hypothetical protein